VGGGGGWGERFGFRVYGVCVCVCVYLDVADIFGMRLQEIVKMLRKRAYSKF
jgi:hypothetical protein